MDEKIKADNFISPWSHIEGPATNFQSLRFLQAYY